MPAVPTDDPVLGPIHTARFAAGLIAASRAQPRTCLLLILAGRAPAGLACADDIRGFQEEGLMSHVFPRSNRSPPPLAMRGEGVYLYDSEGRAYLDGSSGAAVSCLGHGDRDVIAAVKDQMDVLAFAHTRFFSSPPAEGLADLLVAHAPEGIERVYFVSGGSEAVEAALKLARQYFLEIGQPERSRIVARKQSYHGNTLGALAAGGNAWRREQFSPLLVDVSHIAPCYAYRGRKDDETEEAYGRRVADELEAEILRLGPETAMAFIAEPVVGATLGAVPAVPRYFQRVREICDRYGVLLILDEVMCGMGRTGKLFASEHDEVRPDIVAIAKGLGGRIPADWGDAVFGQGFTTP